MVDPRGDGNNEDGGVPTRNIYEMWVISGETAGMIPKMLSICDRQAGLEGGYLDLPRDLESMAVY